MVVKSAGKYRSHWDGSVAGTLVICASLRLEHYLDLVNFQANGSTAPAASAFIASPIRNGTTPFAIAQAIVLAVT